MAAASLALAACGGGGDSTVQTQPTPVPPVKRTPPTRDCTAVPRPDGCPVPPSDPPAGPPVALEGLSTAGKFLALGAIRNTAVSIPLSVSLADARNLPRLRTLQLTHADNKNKVRFGNLDAGWEVQYTYPFQTVAVLPSVGDGDKINYQFDHSRSYSFWGKPSGSSFFPVGSRWALSGYGETSFIASIKVTDYTSRKDIDLGFGDNYNSQAITAEKEDLVLLVDKALLRPSSHLVPRSELFADATLYAEVWSSYSSSNTNDYLLGGVWMLEPKNQEHFSSTRIGAFAQVSHHYVYDLSGETGVPNAVIGTAGYEGSLAGLHISENGDNEPIISRLLGDVNLTADFGSASEGGTIEGTVTNLKLAGKSQSGSLVLPSAMIGEHDTGRPSFTSESPYSLGNINGINYIGHWATLLHGDPANNAHPTGVVGTVGGNGGGNSFVASFGARKVEDQ